MKMKTVASPILFVNVGLSMSCLMGCAASAQETVSKSVIKAPVNAEIADSNSSDIKLQVSGASLQPQTENTREKMYSGKVLSVQGVLLVIENQGKPLKVELKQMTPIKVGDQVQLTGSLVGDTLMAAGVKIETLQR